MKKFEGVLICSDLDETLLKRNKEVSERNLGAIRYFQEEGGCFTVVTGRMPFFAREIYSIVRPNAPIGCINGGGVYDLATERYLWKAELPREALELVEYVDRNVEGIGIQVNGFEELFFCTENSMMAHFRSLTGVPDKRIDYRAVDFPMSKILFGDLDPAHISRLEHLLCAHPLAEKFEFVRSDKALFEILPKGIQKGVVLPYIAAARGIERSRIIAIGDYDNDIGMLREAGIGVAVANASPGAKAAADVVTVSNEEDAIAHLIDALDRGALTFPNGARF